MIKIAAGTEELVKVHFGDVTETQNSRNQYRKTQGRLVEDEKRAKGRFPLTAETIHDKFPLAVETF